MYGYFVLARENILLSSRFSALKNVPDLSPLLHLPKTFNTLPFVTAFRLSDAACLRNLPWLLCCDVEGLWKRGISTPSVEVFQSSKQHLPELKILFNIFLLLNSLQSSLAC